MKDHRPRSFSVAAEFMQDAVTLDRELRTPRRWVPERASAPALQSSVSRIDRRAATKWPTGWLVLLLGFVLLTAVPAWAGQSLLPAGVPNVYDPEVRAHFQPVGVANLRDNPDFPVLLLVNNEEAQPKALLLGLDARNGKDTWSLTADPIILIVVFSDEATIQGLFVDTGFADRGRASGSYGAVDEVNSPALPDLLKAVTAAAKQTYL